MKIADCTLLTFAAKADPRGTLAVVEGDRHVPFAIRRVFYLYGMPAGAERGGHALRTCQQVLIALSGSLVVTVDDGQERRDIVLSRPDQGLLLPPLIWREMKRFSAGTVCLVLASTLFDEADYYREYPAYLAARRDSTGG